MVHPSKNVSFPAAIIPREITKPQVQEGELKKKKMGGGKEASITCFVPKRSKGGLEMRRRKLPKAQEGVGLKGEALGDEGISKTAEEGSFEGGVRGVRRVCEV